MDCAGKNKQGKMVARYDKRKILSPPAPKSKRVGAAFGKKAR